MRFLPRDDKFYDFFEKSAQQAVQGALQLEQLLRNFNDVQVKAKQIKDIEHEGDLITHDTIENFNRTTINPFDREDIHDLITTLDDLLDYIEACDERTFIFKIEKATEESILICCGSMKTEKPCD